VCLHPVGAALRPHSSKYGRLIRLAVSGADLPDRVGLDWSYDWNLARCIRKDSPDKSCNDILFDVARRRGSVAAYDGIPASKLRIERDCPTILRNGRNWIKSRMPRRRRFDRAADCARWLDARIASARRPTRGHRSGAVVGGSKGARDVKALCDLCCTRLGLPSLALLLPPTAAFRCESRLPLRHLQSSPVN
jgi:hypothetical protein